MMVAVAAASDDGDVNNGGDDDDRTFTCMWLVFILSCRIFKAVVIVSWGLLRQS